MSYTPLDNSPVLMQLLMGVYIWQKAYKGTEDWIWSRMP